VRETDHLEVPGVDGRIILKWIIRKWDGAHGQDLPGSSYGQVGGTCERGNEHSGSTKCGVFRD